MDCRGRYRKESDEAQFSIFIELYGRIRSLATRCVEQWVFLYGRIYLMQGGTCEWL